MGTDTRADRGAAPSPLRVLVADEQHHIGDGTL